MFGGSNNSPSGFGSASGNFGAQPVTSNSGAYYTVVFTAFQFRISIISVIVHTVIDEALSTFTGIVFLSLKILENFLEMSIVVILQACLDRCPARRHPDHLVLQPLRLKIHRVLPAIVRQQYQSPVALAWALASAQQCQHQALWHRKHQALGQHGMVRFLVKIRPVQSLVSCNLSTKEHSQTQRDRAMAHLEQ